MKMLFLWLIFTLASAPALACGENWSEPKVGFSSSYGRLSYDQGKSSKELTAISRQIGVSEPGMFTNGLAVVKVEWEISLKTSSRVERGGRICVTPSDVEVFIGFKDPTVYISNELEKGSCRYNMVLRHEQTHQQINKAALDFFIPMLGDAIRRISKDIPPREVDGLSKIRAATDELTVRYSELVKPLVDTFKYELAQEQKRLDNLENYALESQVCKKFEEK